MEANVIKPTEGKTFNQSTMESLATAEPAKANANTAGIVLENCLIFIGNIVVAGW